MPGGNTLLEPDNEYHEFLGVVMVKFMEAEEATTVFEEFKIEIPAVQFT